MIDIENILGRGRVFKRRMPSLWISVFVLFWEAPGAMDFFLDGQAIGKINISIFSQSIAEPVNFELGSALEGHWAI